MKQLFDRSIWPSGPWSCEPDELFWQESSTGYSCLIRRATLGNLCGYVAVPLGHRLYGDEDAGRELNVHGGVTFTGHHFDMEAWVVGFDCGHAGDLSPGVPFLFDRDRYRDFAYVKAECESLAAQLWLMEYDQNAQRRQLVRLYKDLCR